MKDLLPLLLSQKKKKEGIEEEIYCVNVNTDSSSHICMDVRALWTDPPQLKTLCNCMFAHGQNIWRCAWVSYCTVSRCLFDGQCSAPQLRWRR